MTAFTSALPYLIAIFAGATALVLFVGLFTMAAETETEHNQSNRSNIMMRWRVGLQAVTIGLLGLYFLLLA